MTRLALGLALLLLTAAPAIARPPTLDRSFGRPPGFTQLSFRSFETTGSGVAVRADGRVVAVGTTRQRGGLSAFGEDRFAVAVLERNGRPRRTTTVGFAPGAPYGRAVGVGHAGGRIVVAGEARSAAGDTFIALAGLTSSLRLDPAFGDGGRVLLPLGDRAAAVADMALDSQGRIVVAGELDGAMFVRRLEASGLPDLSFGTDGVVREAVLPPASAVTVDSRGRVLVAGLDSEGRTFALTRLRPNGERDTNFANDGVARRRVSGHRGDSAISDVVVLPGGAGYAVAGSAIISRGGSQLVVVRVAVTGVLARFGRGGSTHGGRFIARPGSLVRQPGGKLVAVGDQGGATALVRFLRSGRLDRSFGRNGYRQHRFGHNDGAGVVAAALQGRRLIGVGTDELDERIDYSSWMVISRFGL